MSRQVKRVVLSRREDADLDEVVHRCGGFDAGAVGSQLLRRHLERDLVLAIG